MAISMPKFIIDTGIVDAPIDYSWPKDVYDAYGHDNPRLENKLAKASDRGVVAFSAMVAEWIAWRLSKHSGDPILLNYIEAMWAAVIDWEYIDFNNNPEEELNWKDWEGLVLRPLCATTRRLGRTMNSVMTDQSILYEAVTLTNLLELITPDIKVFRKWRNWAIDRLIEATPRNEEKNEHLGTPVPREILDPTFSYKPEMKSNLLDSYLKNLDYKKNPYLRSPYVMRKNGFRGTPYQYPSL